jgi:hypothetical protein
MKRLSRARRLLGILGALLGLGACATDRPTTGLVDDPAAQTSPVRVPTPGGEAGLLRVLVDASRDGGVWWFPQVAPFSGTDAHQGQDLAYAIRSLGDVVEELPRPFVVTATLLHSYDVVIRANGFGTYSQTEIAAYKEYVGQGGKLLLLADHMMYAPPDGVALAFGIDFEGVTRGDNFLNTFATHSITSGVEPLTYMVGSGIISQPASAQIVGRLSRGSYLDLDKNGIRDPDDPPAPAVLGVMPYGAGRIVFCGDVNLWEQIPQPLVKNVLAWLKQ